ncbi:hypothetical protein FM110_03215 [Brachybacterium nesterenkovii]|uniref:Uncharacterized protein n=1 Tax=Brachybacterium nesterenkovii TaxID=47847 RepID=A0A1X6WV51_9MICO|nr:hypothetical protein FM110_03215 [Brachybacterium nesterenkovii]
MRRACGDPALRSSHRLGGRRAASSAGGWRLTAGGRGLPPPAFRRRVPDRDSFRGWYESQHALRVGCALVCHVPVLVPVPVSCPRRRPCPCPFRAHARARPCRRRCPHRCPCPPAPVSCPRRRPRSAAFRAPGCADPERQDATQIRL